MRIAFLAIALAAVLSAAAVSQAQTIIQSGGASVYVPSTGSGRVAALDPFGNLTVVYPPQGFGPWLYNASSGTLTGPQPQVVSVPGFLPGSALMDPVFVLGF